MIVVSPHLDDAVLSCGQVIAASVDPVHIVTVMAGVPAGDLPLTDFDVRSGFTGARQAVEVRRLEDEHAATVLGATVHHLPFLDRQYAQVIESDDITYALATWLLEHGRDQRVLIPLGILHPDHRQVAVSARIALDTLHWGSCAIAYEELPGRVLHPAEVHTSNLVPWDAPRGPIELKEAAISCYRSQAWHLREWWHACLVPERYWVAP